MKFKLLICLVIFFISITPVYSAVIGVSPSIARFPKMLKGGYAEVNVVVTTSTEMPLKAHFAKEGEIADWIILDPNEEDFIFSREEPYRVNLIIQPPQDAKNGNYSGILKITTDEYATVETGAGSSVIAQVGLLIYVEIIGDEIIVCRAGAISTTSAEVNQPFIIRTTVYNDGNVRLRPEIKVDVWDQYKSQIVFSNTFLGDQILPTRSKEIIKEIQNNLPLGQYFADVIVKECYVTKTTTFDVVEKGQIADSGVLIGIRTNDFGYTNEPLPIAPLFENNGNRKVIAQFKGEIKNLQTGKIETVLESDQLEVNPQESIEFRLFWTPEEIGEYQISGRVVYNNKITFQEQSKVVKIIKGDSKFKFPSELLFIFYIIIGLIILILIGKIRKARKKRRF